MRVTRLMIRAVAIGAIGSAALASQAPARKTIEGQGDHVSAAIELKPGLLMVGGAHKGPRNFIVQLRGEEDDLVFNKSGDYHGVRLFQVKAGAHQFQVQSSAAWVLTYEQPDPSVAGQALPISQTMTGDAPLGPFAMKTGLLTATFTHTGTRNFIVELLQADGTLVGLLVNKTGTYSGTTAERLRVGGNYWIAVQADGLWTVKLSQ